MASAGAIELEQAESESDWAKNRALNVDWIAFKWHALNEVGVYILTNDTTLVPLTDLEKQLNICLRQRSATASVANEHDEEDNDAPTTEERERQEGREEVQGATPKASAPGSASASRSPLPVPLGRSPRPVPLPALAMPEPPPPWRLARPLLSIVPIKAGPPGIQVVPPWER